MYAISPCPRGAGGFTLIESMVGLVVLGILLAVGVPQMTGWLAGTRATGAAQFYADGFAQARNLAMTHNSQSRLVFAPGANGQPGWQIDVCLRSSDNPCTDGSNDWSTATTAAKGATGPTADYRSLVRGADTLPPTTMLTVTLDPADDDAVYFTPLGWIDAGQQNQVRRVDLAPAGALVGKFKPSAVVLTLGGMAVTCVPGAGSGDSRRCPP